MNRDEAHITTRPRRRGRRHPKPPIEQEDDESRGTCKITSLNDTSSLAHDSAHDTQIDDDVLKQQNVSSWGDNTKQTSLPKRGPAPSPDASATEPERHRDQQDAAAFPLVFYSFCQAARHCQLFWSDWTEQAQHELWTAIVQATLRPHEDGSDRGRQKILLLASHQTALQKAARTCIKTAVTKVASSSAPGEGSRVDETIVSIVRLGLHIVRALVMTRDALRSASSLQFTKTALQLVYHAATTVGDHDFTTALLAAETLTLLIGQHDDRTRTEPTTGLPLPPQDDVDALSLPELDTIVLQLLPLWVQLLNTTRPWPPATPDEWYCAVARQWQATNPVTLLTGLAHVARAWTGTIADPKLATRLAKQLYRAVSDAAATMSCSPTEMLQVRRHAIQCLLVDSVSSEDDVGGKLYDTACGAACKAMSAFTKTTHRHDPAATSLVTQFCDNLGPHLDRRATSNWSYAEFCAWRAWHTGETLPTASVVQPTTCGNACYFVRYLYCHHTSCRGSAAPAAIALATFLSALDARRQLQHAEETTAGGVAAPPLPVSAVTLFHECVLTNNDTNVDLEALYRLYAMLELPDLLQKADGTTTTMCSFYRDGVLFVAMALVPLTRNLALRQRSHASSSSYWRDTYLHLACRAVTLCEGVQDEAALDRVTRTLVEDLMQQRCAGADKDHRTMDKVAKVLYSTGRRSEHSQISVRLLAAALELWTNLTKQKGANWLSFRLSQRWSCLAACYRQAEQIEAALVAAAFALVYNAIEQTLDTAVPDDGYEATLTVLFELGLPDISLPGTTHAWPESSYMVACQFAEIAFQHGGESDCNAAKKECRNGVSPTTFLSWCRAESATDIAYQFKSHCGLELNVVSVLRVVVGQTLAVEKAVADRSKLAVCKSVILALSMTAMGKRLIDNDVMPRRHEALSSLFSSIASLASSLIQASVKRDSALIQSLQALLFAAAAKSTQSADGHFDSWVLGVIDQPDTSGKMPDTLYQRAIKTARGSQQDRTGSNSDWILFVVHSLLLLEYLRSQTASLALAVHEGDVFGGIVTAVLSAAVSVESNSLSRTGRRLAAALFTALCGCLTVLGETLIGTQLAALAYQYWSSPSYKVLLSSFISHGGSLRLPDIADEDSDTSPFWDLNSQSSGATSKIPRDAPSAALLASESRLKQILSDELFAQCPSKHKSSAAWSKTTALLDLATIHCCQGKTERAIQDLDQCAASCAEQMKRLRKRYGTGDGRCLMAPAFQARQLCAMQRIAYLRISLGDYRRAARAAAAVVRVACMMGAAEGEAGDHSSCSEATAPSKSISCLGVRAYRCRMFTQLAAGTWEDRNRAFDAIKSATDGRRPTPSFSRNAHVEKTFDEMTVCLFTQQNLRDSSTTYLSKADGTAAEGAARWAVGSDFRLDGTLYDGLKCEATIAKLRARFAAGGRSFLPTREDMSSCLSVIASEHAPAICKAWAHYFLGAVYIQDGNTLLPQTAADGMTGAIEAFRDARANFQKVLAWHKGACDSLTRKTVRYLVELSTCENTNDDNSAVRHALSTSVLMARQRSLARGADCVTLTSHRDEQNCNTESSVDGTSNELECKSLAWDQAAIMDVLRAHSPVEWRYITIAIGPQGNLLVEVLYRSNSGKDFQLRTLAVEPSGDSESVYDDLIKPLDALIAESQRQLAGVDHAAADAAFDTDELRREWWNRRKIVDDRLFELLDYVGTTYFESDEIESCLQESALDSLSCGNLTSKFDAAAQESDETSVSVSVAVDSCTFLILDEHLCRFPFECLPCFLGLTMYRIASLAHVAACLLDQAAAARPFTVVSDQVTVILDPESNLAGTQARMTPFLRDLSTDCTATAWPLIVGRAPTSDEMEAALTTDNGLLLYFGHGGGQSFISRQRLESLVNVDSHGRRQGRATAILMGCSSGRLESVNLKNSTWADYIDLEMEPEGIALSYLQAGVPCVVANLWDVTDRDIDAFAQDLLRHFVHGNESLGQSVAKARAACRLRGIVGAAPVCYGLPVYFEKL